MRSLFLKIFIWFWLAMVLVSATLAMSVAITQSRSDEARMRFLDNTLLPLQAQLAAEIFEQQGPTELRRHLGEFDQDAPMRGGVFVERGGALGTGAGPGMSAVISFRMRSWLFDEQGKNVLGPGAPPALTELAVSAARTGKPEFRTDVAGPGRFLAQRATGPSGKEYVLVTERPPRPPLPIFLLPLGPNADLQTQLLRLTAVLLVVGGVCFWLAKYIAAPVLRLQAAVRRLAEGDLTARVGPTVGKRRDELGDLARDFDNMAERIESLLTSQRRLLQDISHELRSPLARLHVALGLARQRGDAAPSGALDRIEREADQLNTMIGQVLTLARFDSGAERIDQERLDLAQLIRETAEDAEYEARSLSRSIRLVRCEDCVLMGTEALLRSAIENVVRNAVRYAPEGTEVEVGLSVLNRSGDAMAMIRVRDHGPGVSEDALIQIFRPFYREGDHRDRRTGGTGLGLAITERAVRLHGGSVSASNASDGGLVVEIALPVGTSQSRHESLPLQQSATS